MSKSVRVGDYYGNDENGVWSWYLSNLRSGDFEEIIENKLKYTLLKRFLNNNLLGNFSPESPTRFINKKLIFVSIPEDVHQDISILELFLRDYFHLKVLDNIQIHKLTQDKVYHHENHYFLMDELNNFEDPTFLEFGKSNWKMEGTAGTVYDPQNKENTTDALVTEATAKIDHKISSSNTDDSRFDTLVNDTKDDSSSHEYNDMNLNEQDSITSSNNNDSLLSSLSTGGEDSLNQELRRQSDHDESSSIIDQTNDNRESYPNADTIRSKMIPSEGNISIDFDQGTDRESTNVDNSNKPTGLDDDGASSIVLNFSHNRNAHKRKTKIDSLLGERYPSDFYTPPQSELVSINSCGSAEDYTGQSLRLMVTKNGTDSKDDQPGDNPNRSKTSVNGHIASPLSDIQNVSINEANMGGQNDQASFSDNESESMYSSDLESEDGEMDHYNASGSDITLLSILPSISIFDTLGYFRLVLQSILIQDPQTKEVFTAVRQSNNKPTIADITDDWLLYDAEFSMHNLQILTLQDIMTIKKDYPKILFYTMVVINDRSEIACEFPYNGAQFTKAPSPITNKSHEVEKEELDQPTEVQAYFPGNSQAIKDSIKPNNRDSLTFDLCQAERTKSNMTTTHRSIRTVNSIGDWSISRDTTGIATRAATNTSGQYEDHYQALKFDESSKERLIQGRKDGSGGKYSKHQISRVNTNGSSMPLDSVERTKSLPLPTLLKTASGIETSHIETPSKWGFRSIKRHKNKHKSKGSLTNGDKNRHRRTKKNENSACVLM